MINILQIMLLSFFWSSFQVVAYIWLSLGADKLAELKLLFSLSSLWIICQWPQAQRFVLLHETAHVFVYSPKVHEVSCSKTSDVYDWYSISEEWYVGAKLIPEFWKFDSTCFYGTKGTEVTSVGAVEWDFFHTDKLSI